MLWFKLYFEFKGVKPPDVIGASIPVSQTVMPLINSSDKHKTNKENHPLP